MPKGKWGEYLDQATCGHDRCKIHRMKREFIQVKYYNWSFERIVGLNYSSEELQDLRRVANGMG